MNLLKIVAVSALVISGSALATTPPTSSLPVFQTTNWNAEIQIYQAGTANRAQANQSGVSKSLTTVDQRGSHNKVGSNQTGNNSLVNVSQAGSWNNANVLQASSSSITQISQNGTGNYAQSNQYANGSLANIQQYGSANQAYASQH
jgi:major curlin subunit